MNNWFVNNREVIRNLALNTGTSTAPAFTALCTTSELTLNVDNEVKDFFVFCDAIKRSVITGTSLQLSATVKIDINNTAIQTALGDLHTLITSGEVAQFNNQLVQFELLDEVSGTTLSYVKYQVPVVMNISELGGAAEDEG
jgi:hypothetical protein